MVWGVQGLRVLAVSRSVGGSNFRSLTNLDTNPCGMFSRRIDCASTVSWKAKKTMGIQGGETPGDKPDLGVWIGPPDGLPRYVGIEATRGNPDLGVWF